ncbi:MAG: FkbM family methyltransferase [Acidobacteria bacterium]|nr:MAG: FkbM family methyltransferase [Acidobacteriota bacterium]
MSAYLPAPVFQLLGGVKQRAVPVFARAGGVESLATHLAALLRLLEVDCVLDVGANRGQYARLLRRIGYRGRIVSFEPVPESFEELRRRAAGDPRWTTVPIALGAADTVLPLHVTSVTEFSSLRDPSDYARRTFPGTVVTRTVQVPVRCLDGLWAEHVRAVDRVHLKLDTQGYDQQVLEGARDVLDRVVSVQTELAVKSVYDGVPHYTEAIPRLEARGFELTGVFPVLRDPQLRIVELDCVMRRSPAPEGAA